MFGMIIPFLSPSFFRIERKRSEYFNKKQLSLLAESLEDPQATNNNSTIKRDNEGKIC